MTARSTLASAWLVALLAHGAALGFLFLADPPRSQALQKRPPVRVRLVNRERPVPVREVQPALPPVEPAPAPKAMAPDKPVKASPPRKRVPSERPAPRAAEVAAPQPAPQAPVRRFAVSLEATVASGGVAVPVAAPGQASGVGAIGEGTPTGVLGGRSTRVAEPTPPPPASKETVEADEATKLPVLLAEPSGAELRRFFPEEARRNGQEGDVALKILVGLDGQVKQVRFLRRAGHGFDEAAAQIVKRFRFKPGQRGSRPVAVWIPWTYRFRLDG